MRVRIFQRLAWLLAVGVSTAASAVVAQDAASPVYQNTSYMAVEDVSRVPATESGAQATLISENKSLTEQNADLSARLADVEKALKKIDDKAKEDKKTAEGKMTATPSGRIHIDAANFSQDAVSKARTNEQNGVEFRAARLAIYGGGFNVIKYQIEYDFSTVATTSTYNATAGTVGTSTRLRCKDTYFMITDLPLVQNIEIGHFKEPFSLDELTSDNYITFMERNTANEMMAPKRHFGVMGFGNTESERATYALGGFYEYDDEGNPVQNDNMGGALTMRGTWLPYYDEATEGRGLIHTGLAYSYRDPYRNQCALKYRPESHLAKENSMTLTDVDERNEIGMELANVYGPFSMQAEYYVNYIDRSAHENCKTQGAYVYMSYFLTGESRPYDRKRGVFGRVKPLENFFRVRDQEGNVYTGKGAWEVKYRYSWLDAYDDGALGFQTCGDHTVGLNWYLNPYTRFMFEYIHSSINQYTGLGAGQEDIFQTRAAIDF